MMASKDAPTSPDGASGAGQLVPEANTAEQISMDPVAGASTAVATAGQVNMIDPWIFNNLSRHLKENLLFPLIIPPVIFCLIYN